MAAPGGIPRRQRSQRAGPEHLRHLQKEAFQLAYFYFVFQVVMFTSFCTHASNIKCHYLWLALSLLVTCLNLGIVYAVTFKYTSTLDKIDRNNIMVALGNPGKSTVEPMLDHYVRPELKCNLTTSSASRYVNPDAL
ncbi:UNVERIFIED_CONTAM: hypothetical protein Sangu_1836200 [Sesamum angustifolium]|uniref:Uncharacterized protein n=1 Tax=Sesamum angustifolium TaxID=2727405 RepID=A0AAW2MB02_9LAMI